MSNIIALGTPADDPPHPGNPEDPAARLARQCCHFEFESKLNQFNMAKPTVNTRKVAAAMRKTEEHKEESKEVKYDDE